MKTDYQWYTSCSPGWTQHNNTFEFYLKKGTPGECPNDDKPLEGLYEFKERQEIRSDRLEPGTYVWQADVETISDELIHASYFHLFQIHDGRIGGRPPHCIQVRNGDIFLCNQDEECVVSQYKGKLSITANISIEKESITVRYTFDGKYVGTIKSETRDRPIVKFGAYRWNAVCDVKQVYKNVKFGRIDVS